MATPVFIYALSDPREPLRLRYIGVASDPYARYESHLKEAKRNRRNHRLNWLRSLRASGLDPLLEVIDVVDGRECGFYTEVEYLRLFRAIGFPLVNATDGGQGSRGHIVSLEARARLSRLNSGANNPGFGKPLTENRRKKIGASLRASPRAKAQRSAVHEKRRREGFKHSPEAKIKCGLKNIGRRPSAETREKLSAAQIRRRAREATYRKGGN